MSKPTNPLLIAIRAAFPKIDCVRTYTTAYKAGGFRVKLYCCAKLPSDIRAKLAKAGYADISVKPSGSPYRPSFTIRAALSA